MLSILCVLYLSPQPMAEERGAAMARSETTFGVNCIRLRGHWVSRAYGGTAARRRHGCKGWGMFMSTAAGRVFGCY